MCPRGPTIAENRSDQAYFERKTRLLRGAGVISEMRNRIADISTTQAIDHLLTHCNKSVAKFHFDRYTQILPPWGTPPYLILSIHDFYPTE
jgi:hypothetical protein